ncbi:MAG: orotidine 5'-phosphate decarboxylase [Candidatus Sungbacteria bacterium]|nr:orotidine 5'-phosphate decarboxylase [Candidatus Sungbacteria bacterium]
MKTPILFIALDGLVLNERKTLNTAYDLNSADGRFGFKVNLDYLLKHGIRRAVRRILDLGRPVFADLKMWHDERAMVSVTDELMEAGVDYFNIYALADGHLIDVVRHIKKYQSHTKVLALTVLSYLSEPHCREFFRRTTAEAVNDFAGVAVNTGCDGIILPGAMLNIFKKFPLMTVATGIRPKWFRDARHRFEVEPAVAVARGADGLVCGSPIMKNEDPVAALKMILAEIEAAT